MCDRFRAILNIGDTLQKCGVFNQHVSILISFSYMKRHKDKLKNFQKEYKPLALQGGNNYFQNQKLVEPIPD